MTAPPKPPGRSGRPRHRALLAAAVAALLVVVVLVVVVLGLSSVRQGPDQDDAGPPPTSATDVPQPSPTAPGEQVRPALTWAPPALDDPERVVLEDGGQVRLDDDRDYVIEAPTTIEGPVVLRGGRNIVWVGGHIQISDRGDAARPTERRALVVQDGEEAEAGRTVHLEGLLIDGSDLSEGIDVNAPSTVLQLQNCRITGVHFRGEDDLEGTGAYEAPNHPDIVQTWGSVGELRIDGLSGTSAYQGLFLKADQNQPHGPVWLRRVDLAAVSSVGEDQTESVGHRLLYWDPENSGPLHIDPGTVWIDHDPRSRWGPDFGQNVHPPTSAPDGQAAETGRDERGTYVTWGQDVELSTGETAVRDFTGRGPGHVYSGSPPGGSYVPEGEAGDDYASPGYRGDDG